MNKIPAKDSRAKIAALLVVLLVSAACVHNPPSTAKQTALQQTIIYNSAVAKANRAVEQAIEDAQKNSTITVAQARPAIVGCGKIATASAAVSAITSKGTEATWSIDGPKIRAILSSAQLNLSPTQIQSVDLAISALNSAIDLLKGVK